MENRAAPRGQRTVGSLRGGYWSILEAVFPYPRGAAPLIGVKVVSEAVLEFRLERGSVKPREKVAIDGEAELDAGALAPLWEFLL